MNERIKDLLDNHPALERLKDFYDVGPVQRAAVEDFAELVVRECIRVVNTGWAHDHEQRDANP